jgi:hypothetical protein
VTLAHARQKARDARRLLADQKSWRNEKHRAQWRSTFGDVRLFLKSGHLFQKLETAKRHSVTVITSCVVSVR